MSFYFHFALGRPGRPREICPSCLRVLGERQGVELSTFRYPVRRSRLRWMFFISPYSANLSWMSSSVASSWTPVTKRIQPSTAVGEGREVSTQRKAQEGPSSRVSATPDPAPLSDGFHVTVSPSLQTHARRLRLLTALRPGLVAILLHAVVILPHPRSRPLF